MPGAVESSRIIIISNSLGIGAGDFGLFDRKRLFSAVPAPISPLRRFAASQTYLAAGCIGRSTMGLEFLPCQAGHCELASQGFVNALAAELQTNLRPSGHPTTLQAAWAARRPVG
jgi:hypothetical protein